LTANFSDTLHVLTVVADASRVPHIAAGIDEGVLVHRLEGTAGREMVLGATSGTTTHAGYRTDGRVAVLRESEAGLVSYEQAGGSFINVSGGA
jgi:hypothetical protein